jgi:hypothetical protein
MQLAVAAAAGFEATQRLKAMPQAPGRLVVVVVVAAVVGGIVVGGVVVVVVDLAVSDALGAALTNFGAALFWSSSSPVAADDERRKVAAGFAQPNIRTIRAAAPRAAGTKACFITTSSSSPTASGLRRCNERTVADRRRRFQTSPSPAPSRGEIGSKEGGSPTPPPV